MAGFLSAAAAVIGSSGIGGSLVRLIVAYGVSRLINKSTGKQNSQQIDQGIRLQLQPNTTNPVPLLYGGAFYSGNITDAQLTNNNKTMWVCLTISEHTASNRLSDNTAVNTFINGVYLDNQLVTFKADGITVDFVTNSDGTVDTSARDLIKIYLYKNGSAAPTLPIGSAATLPPAANTLFPGWDSTWTMTNLTFALVKIDYNRDKGITGIPTLKFNVSNTLFKPGDALYDYMTNTVSGAALKPSQIDTASLIALNNYADDAINFFNENTGTTETLANRYQINGVINPQQNVMDNMQEIANSAGVYINYDISTGKWGTIIDKNESAVFNFNDSNIVGGIDVSSTSLDSIYNSVEVTFPSRFIQDQTDTVYIELPTEFRNQNEPDNKLNINLTMLNEPVQARVLAYLALYQNRQDRVITFTTDYSKISVSSGDVITVTNTVYGFVNQLFRVIRVKEVETDVGSILIEIVAQEYDATLYTAGGVPRRPRTPSTPANLPSLGIIATPAAPLVTTANNNRQPSILLSGVVPAGVVDRFEFWYSTDNFTSSTLIHEEKNANGAPFNSSTTILTRVATLPAGTYKFKVRAGNELSYSDYSPASAELVWEPVQTTDAVDENTKMKVSDLLPILGMGALAYFAYKALYPELLKALSNTQLGQLLGIEDPAEAAQRADELEQESTAFRLVTAGGVQMTPEVDNSLTFVAGTGITIAGNINAHSITISATGGGGGTGGATLIAGTGIKLTENTAANEILIENTCCDEPSPDGNPVKPPPIQKDYGIANITFLDTCQTLVTTPERKKQVFVPAKPAIPDTYLKITGSGTWYDPCYKRNIETIIISDPDNLLNMMIGDTKTLTGKLTAFPVFPFDQFTRTGSIPWSVQFSYTLNQFVQTVRIKKVGANSYVAIKNFTSNSVGAPIQTAYICDIFPIENRPLFGSVDYPAGYELATYSNLAPVLTASAGGLNFITIQGQTATQDAYVTKIYPSVVTIGTNSRICIKSYTVKRYELIKFVGNFNAITGDSVTNLRDGYATGDLNLSNLLALRKDTYQTVKLKPEQSPSVEYSRYYSGTPLEGVGSPFENETEIFGTYTDARRTIPIPVNTKITENNELNIPPSMAYVFSESNVEFPMNAYVKRDWIIPTTEVVNDDYATDVAGVDYAA